MHKHLLGQSKSTKRILKQIERVAKTDSRVLITGETGVGKEIVAHLIHRKSGRSGPFVACDCASIPEHLVDNELFGHVRGAYTGATQVKKGLLHIAHRGTLFLDEIGDMCKTQQGRLLRFLDSKKYSPVGSNNLIVSNARVIAATNQDLLYEIRTNKFRPGLYYRLNVIRIHISPLRYRIKDVDEIATHYAAREGMQISPTFMRGLKRHSWPGNIRDLIHFIRQQALLAKPDCGILQGDPSEILSRRFATLYRTPEKDYKKGA